MFKRRRTADEKSAPISTATASLLVLLLEYSSLFHYNRIFAESFRPASNFRRSLHYYHGGKGGALILGKGSKSVSSKRYDDEQLFSSINTPPGHVNYVENNPHPDNVTPSFSDNSDQHEASIRTNDDDDDDDDDAPKMVEQSIENSMTPVSFADADPYINDHRYAASDWLQNMRSLPRSTILRAIQGPVLTVMAWSVLVSTVYRLLVAWGYAGMAAKLSIPHQPHSFLVSALGLLLVFRTNSAYQRFNEGRKIWERILSLSRNLTRMALLYERELGTERRCRVFRLLAAFPYLLHHHIQPQCNPALRESPFGLIIRRNQPIRIRRRQQQQQQQQKQQQQQPVVNQSNRNKQKRQRQQQPFQQDVDPAPFSDASLLDPAVCWVDRRDLPWSLFPNAALQAIAISSNRPLWVCDRLAQELKQVVYTDNFTSRERLKFLAEIDKLSQCIGECERIHQTAVPLNYARHSLRSLTLWLFTLPFALVKDFGWLTGPVMGLASWLLYGIYQIGYTIEEPFQGSLRLSSLCNAIYRDVMYGTDFMTYRMTAFHTNEEEKEAWKQLDIYQLLPSAEEALASRP